MPESPSGYFPDYKIQPVPNYRKGYKVETQRALSGRRQSRVVGLPQRFLSMATVPLPQADRKVISDFLDSKQGSFAAFYLFHPVPEDVASFAAGSVTAATSITLPWKGPWWVGQTPMAATFVSATVGGAAPTSPVLTPNIGSGGEDRLSWTGAMTGAVLITATLVRLRLQVQNGSDDIDQNFDPLAADAFAIFPVSFLELI